MTAEAIAQHAPWELRAAATRAATCAHCPSSGGACDGERGYYSEGLRPEWDDGTLRPVACDRWSQYAKRRTLVAAGIAPHFLGATLDGYYPRNQSQEHALAKAREFAERASVRDRMLIAGPTGVGKTHLACATLSELSERGSVMFAYVPEFVDTVRSELLTGSAATMERAKSVDFLVLDDLGAERSTEYVRETLEKLLNLRLVQKRSIIFTQNVTPDQIASSLGLPVMRRVMFDTGVTVQIDGSPYGLKGGK